MLFAHSEPRRNFRDTIGPGLRRDHDLYQLDPQIKHMCEAMSEKAPNHNNQQNYISILLKNSMLAVFRLFYFIALLYIVPPILPRQLSQKHAGALNDAFFHYQMLGSAQVFLTFQLLFGSFLV